MEEMGPKVSPAFLVVTFAAAIAVGIAVIYFGIHGQLGGTIP
jgi:hypothetical protein